MVDEDGFLRVSGSLRIPDAELSWRFSRSGGPGGQHANTSDTRAEVRFDVLPDGTILVEDEVGDTGLAPLAEAVEATLPPPYRARAVRRTDARWAIQARGIRVVELPDQSGDAIEITDRDGVRELKIDGERSFGSVPALEQLASAQFPDYALQAQRLDGDLWELRVDPL